MDERRPATDEEARALASSLRLRILRICLGEGRTNKEIAGILGRDPASVLHHIRTLVRTGFLEPQEARRGARGAREIPYLATRKSWQLSAPAWTAHARHLPGGGRPRRQRTPDPACACRPPAGRVPHPAARPARGVRPPPGDPAAPAWSLFLALHPDPNRP